MNGYCDYEREREREREEKGDDGEGGT